MDIEPGPISPPESRRFRFGIGPLMTFVAGSAVLFGGLAWAAKLKAVARYLWFLDQAFDCSLGFFPWFAGLSGLALLTALVAACVNRRFWRWRSIWVLLPTLIPFAILAVGLLLEHGNDTWPAEESQRLHLLDSLFNLQILMGLVLLGCLRTRTHWLVILGIMVASIWLSLGSLLMSTMSITNIWL